jgi:hypothetical protein
MVTDPVTEPPAGTTVPPPTPVTLLTLRCEAQSLGEVVKLLLIEPTV